MLHSTVTLSNSFNTIYRSSVLGVT